MSRTNGSHGNGHIREIDRERGYELLDEQTREFLGMSAHEFIEAWRSGKLHDEGEYPEAVRLSLMIPLAA